jgi:hypothetical protein
MTSDMTIVKDMVYHGLVKVVRELRGRLGHKERKTRKRKL